MKKFGTAVILCGGKSSRMGFDKCMLRIKDKLLVEIIAEKLEEIFDNVILLSDNKNKFDNTRYKVYEDIIPDLGPIGALYSSLKYANSEHVFIIGCDMPVININFIKFMMSLIKTKFVKGVVARKAQFIEPLYAFYSKSMIQAIEDQINEGNYKMLEIINKSNVYFIDESEVRKYSSDLDIFTNLNFESDLLVLKDMFID